MEGQTDVFNMESQGCRLPLITTATTLHAITTMPIKEEPSWIDIRSKPPRKASNQTRAQCTVCADEASGVYFGALVCLPCKSFFIRSTRNGLPIFTCPENRKCDVSRQNRLRCQSCRYDRCLRVGMRRKEKPEIVYAREGQELCKICGDIANGTHFGVVSCEGCKKFFRRGLGEADTYVCRFNTKCVINPRNRNVCRYCRFRKCLDAGMSRDAIRMGRPKNPETNGNGQQGYKKHQYFYGKKVQTDQCINIDGGNMNDEMESDKAMFMQYEKPSCIYQSIPNPDYMNMLNKRFGNHSVWMEDSVFTSGAISIESTCYDNNQWQNSPGEPGYLSLPDKSTENTPPESAGCHVLPTIEIDEMESILQNLENPYATTEQPRDMGNPVQLVEHCSMRPIHGQLLTMDICSGRGQRDSSGYSSSDSPSSHGSPFSNDSPYHTQDEYNTVFEFPSTGNACRATSSPQYMFDLEGAGSIFSHSNREFQLAECNIGSSSYLNVKEIPSSHNSPLGSRPRSAVVDMLDTALHNFIDNHSGFIDDCGSENKPKESLTASSALSKAELVKRKKRQTLERVNKNLCCFDRKYWYRESKLPKGNGVFILSPAQKEVVDKLLESYKELFELSPMLDKVSTSTSTIDDSNTSRKNDEAYKTNRRPKLGVFLRMMIPLIRYTLELPGIKSLSQMDKHTLIRKGIFHLMILLKSMENSGQESSRFETIWGLRIPHKHPAYHIKKELQKIGRDIDQLELDRIEKALMCALSVIAADWKNLREKEKVAALRKPILDIYYSYIQGKFPKSAKRLVSVMKTMTKIRELSAFSDHFISLVPTEDFMDNDLSQRLEELEIKDS